ncbi:MAG TPA: GGDEF domain-containing protein [Holophaga sp.]|nr:GGDEF domain-containing protein [Holophaga sp.]
MATHSGNAIRWYLIWLLAISISLMGLQYFGLNRVIRIDAKSRNAIRLMDDSASGGRSTSVISRDGSRFILDADLKPGFAWPYMQLEVRFTRNTKGIDLSKFNEIRIKAEHQGPAPHKLRVFLRSFDPAYADPLELNTWKPNEAVFVPFPGEEVRLPLRNFAVSNWWRNDFQVPIDQAGMDLRHAVLLQINTPDNAQLGHHRIIIDHIEIWGKWVSREQMAIGVLFLWIGSALFFLLMDLRQLRRSLQRSRNREKQLKQLSQTLEIENRTIGDMARRDPLTGVRNRAGILDELFQECEDAHRTGHPLALIFMDIDHFKLVNDRHGHAVGDEVLREFARNLEMLTRRSDYLIRWGGEEFVLICPETSLEDAVKLAEKARKHLEQIQWPMGIALTASFGVTVLGDDPIQKGLERADAALYDAKNAGRNCVKTSPALSGEQMQ